MRCERSSDRGDRWFVVWLRVVDGCAFTFVARLFSGARCHFDLFWAAAAASLAFAYPRRLYPKPSRCFARPSVLRHFLRMFIGYIAFRLSDGISRYFSVHDALNVVKAALTSSVMTSVLFFTLTRLEGIPRSTPVLQFLLLVVGGSGARTRNAHNRFPSAETPSPSR